MLRKFPLLTLLTLLVISIFHVDVASAQSFKDTTTHYAAKEIKYLVDRDIIAGFPDGTFRPNAPITRADAIVIVGRAIGLSDKQTQTTFPDVPKAHYASGYINDAYRGNIIGGYSDGTFRPGNQVTRGEMAIIIANAFQYKQTRDIYYHDVAITDPKYRAINLITTAGISVGYPSGVFKPNDSITRAEYAVMIARALNPSLKVEHKNVTQRKYVTATSLNVRSGAGITNAIIGKLAQNREVQIHYKYDKDWVYMESGNIKGFVHQNFLADKKVPQAKPPTQPPKPNRVVAIDAGHGGNDPGSKGNGIIEKEVNFDVARRVQRKLEKAGIKVIMTRKSDTFVSLSNRVSIAVNGGADTFVSIHSNAFSNPSANGTETFYSTTGTSKRVAGSKKLATLNQRKLVTALKTTDRGVKTAGFQVIKHNPLPAVLVELAFLTNKGDAAKLSSKTHRENAAEAIARSIIEYYQ